jgi:hypothetical protein
VDADAPCTSTAMVTMTSPFTAAGSLLVAAGPGRLGVPSSCTEHGRNAHLSGRIYRIRYLAGGIGRKYAADPGAGGSIYE